MCLNHTVYMPGEMDLLQVLFKKFEKELKQIVLSTNYRLFYSNL